MIMDQTWVETLVYMVSDHMVKDYSYSERENYMGYSFRLAARVLLYAPPHGEDSTAFVTPIVEHWLEWETAQWVHHKGSIWRPIAPWANALIMELHLTPRNTCNAMHYFK